jgi:RNA polymerase sigma factor (sigma-70 family)
MNSTLDTHEFTDTQLVERCVTGDREAFGLLGARYQSLICSMAYSASGDISRSEDLAQETFINAWSKLKSLREPAKFRAWLCGIARNLINGSVRKQKRTPVDSAVSLDEISDSTCPLPSPSDQAISGEEAALVWQSLEKVPENYREPLVLFYRQNQSVSRVAETLELSEDAVKQRLSRGRKLLNEQVTALVESTLTRTRPTKAFTAAVLIALPVLTPQIAAAGVAVTAAKSPAAKTVLAAGIGGALWGPLIVILGAWIGMRAGIRSAKTPRERQFMIRSTWITMGFVITFIAAFMCVILFGRTLSNGNETVFISMLVALVITQCLSVPIMVLWMNKNKMRIRKEEGTYIKPKTVIGNQRGEMSRNSVFASFAGGIFGGTIWMVIMAYKAGDWLGMTITLAISTLIYFTSTTACLRNPQNYLRILMGMLIAIGIQTFGLMNWRWNLWFEMLTTNESASF